MKFIINATNLSSGGALQVTRSLMYEWGKTDMGHEFHFFLSPYFSESDSSMQRPWLHIIRLGEKPVYGTVQMSRHRRFMQQQELKIGPDAILTVFGPSLWRPESPHLCGFANGVFLFSSDAFIKERFRKGLFSKLSYALRRMLLFRELKNNADHFWVETETAAKALSREVNISSSAIASSATRIPGYCATHPRHPKAIRCRLLYLSAYYPHKNFEILPSLIGQLATANRKVTFLLTLPEPAFQKLTRQTSVAGYLENIGPVTTEQLQRCYDQCDAAFIPSLLETFSASFPEAMQAGKPILCSDRPFAHDICGDAALYFDPLNVQDIAAKIENIVSSERLAGNTHSKRFCTARKNGNS
ncbi:MAG: glycosyltransferase [Chitinophagaceae bacterium]